MTALLKIQLFSGLHMSLGDALVTGFVSNKVPALLAYLAMTRRPHQRSALAALLWGELPDVDARNNLRQMIGEHLVVSRETIAFNRLAPYTLDCEAFERRLEDAAQTADLNVRVAALREAVTLYQGDFLSGLLLRDALIV